MKRLILVLFMLLGFGFTSSAGVAAQAVPDVEESVIDLTDIKGLQSAYSRAYMIDFMAMLATPDLNMDAIDAASFMRIVSITGYTFDSEDNARAFLTMNRDEMGASFKDATELQNVEISDLKDFGKDGLQASMSVDIDGSELYMVIIVFEDGNNLFTVVAMDETAEAANSTATNVAEFVRDAKPDDAAVVLHDDGTSTGGVFSRMPVAGDTILGGIAPFMDADMLAAGQ